MTAKNIMQRAVITVTPRTTIEEVIRVFMNKGISGCPVVDDVNRIVGIVTEADLIYRAVKTSSAKTYSDHTAFIDDYRKNFGDLVAHVMTKNVISLEEDTPLDEVVKIMKEKKIRIIPITLNHILTGIITREDVLKFILNKLAEAPCDKVCINTKLNNDEEITLRVIDALKKNMNIQIISPRVKTLNGVVYLKGIAESIEEVKIAEEVISHVPGVKGISNELVVKLMVN